MAYKHRDVADLAWVIQSPPVLSGFIGNTRWLNQADCRAEYHDCSDALQQLDSNPEPLLIALAGLKPYIIGQRFERLIRFWLEISPNFDVLAQNYVLQGSQQTLGEADFFIRELASDKLIHLEVAVKFYLGTDDLSQMNSWYGTNLKDRLDIKFNRMVEHQTQLSRKYPELMPYPVDESWCLLKGRMFYPHDRITVPPFFADQCPTGKWCYPDSLPSNSAYTSLDKRYWLSEVNDYDGELRAIPKSVEHSRCFAEIQNAKEVGRYFVLPDDFWGHQG